MKPLKSLFMVFIVLTVLAPVVPALDGSITAGGGYDSVFREEIDGTEIEEMSAYAQGGLTLNWARGESLWAVYAEMRRDDFYDEASGRLSYTGNHTFWGNLYTALSYIKRDDITETDNNNATFQFFLSSTRYREKRGYWSGSISYDYSNYSREELGLSDYHHFNGRVSAGLGDIYLSLQGERRDYKGDVTPDYTSADFLINGYFYPGSWVLNTSGGLSHRSYAFSTEELDDYYRGDMSLRAGYKISSSLTPFLLGEVVLYREKEGLGDYLQWEGGMEWNFFANPLTLIFKTGKKAFVEDSESRLSYSYYVAEGSWSIWSGPWSLYIGNMWELQKIEDLAHTTYPEAKNSNYINSLYGEISRELGRSLTLNCDISYEWKEFFIEDEMNANYNQADISFGAHYNLLFKYIFSVEGGYRIIEYPAFPENDSKRWGVSASLEYGF